MTFPSQLECIPLAVYRHRPDGTPGREITVQFVGGKLHGNARMELKVDGLHEVIELKPPADGLESTCVLLPDGVGVGAEARVLLALRQGAHECLAEVVVPAMRHWTIYLYPHSHVDIGYTNTQRNVETLHKNNILEGIKLAIATKDYPEGARYRWNPEITWPLERLWESMPEHREAVLAAIRDGSLCVDASYLHLNTSTCADEELFHAFEFSREIEKLTGQPIETFQQFDIPGITWGLLPVMAQQGIRYIMSWPNTDRAGLAHEGINQRPFWWMSQDGRSKILFFQPGIYCNEHSQNKAREINRPWFGQRDPDKVPAVIRTGHANVNFIPQIEQYELAGHPYDFLVISWSLWDNTPIDADLPDAVKEWNEQHAFPRLLISGSHEIMESIERRYGDQLPVVTGDYTEYWTDGSGTGARLTASNRNAKERLIQAETLWTMLRPGRPAPRAEFNEAWRYIALGSEHTWCAENPAEPFFQDAIWKVKQSYFREAAERAQTLLDDALAPATDGSCGALGPVHGPSVGGIAVFNTHSWIHGGLVTLTPAESQLGDRVTDDHGNDVPCQRLTTGELVFLASEVPALGSRHYRVVAGTCPLDGGCQLSGTTLENQHLRVVLDPATGNISQLVTLKDGRNFVDPAVHGGLNAFRWIPANVDDPRADAGIKISVIEEGPLVCELRVDSQAPGCRALSRSVRLVASQPWLEITNVVDKLPLLEKDGIHFGFGFEIPGGMTRFDIPWGVTEIEKDQWPQANRNWLTMQRWLDISNDQLGVTWCSLDTPLFEHGAITANISLSWGAQGPWLRQLEPSSTVYSWAMNNHWHTNFPLTQDGPVVFRYRILPHGAYDAAEANRFGLEQAQPLAHVAANHPPEICPLVAIDHDRVCVTILKPLADEGAVIVRLRSLSERAESVKLRFPAGQPKAIHLCERETIPGPPLDDSVDLPPYGFVTLRVQS